MTINELSESERPREKLLENGAQALSNGELLAVLLRTGTRGRSVLEMAQELLASAEGSLVALFSFGTPRLSRISGIKKDKAATLQAAAELGRRFLSESSGIDRRTIVSPRMVYDEMLPLLKGLDHEEFWVMFLNSAHYRTGRERISVGTLDSTPFDTRKLARLILDRNAAGIILVHNHPGGNPRPSAADSRNTEALKTALSAFGIDFIDHVIVSDESFFSFSDGRVYSR